MLQMCKLKLCAHMPAWIRGHLDTVCIWDVFRDHRAGPEHNCLSKFNANDHNNTLSAVIRETCQAANRKPSSSRAWRYCPAETTCSPDTSTTDTIQFEPGYTCCPDRSSLISLSCSLFLVYFPQFLLLSSNSECSFYFCLSCCSLVSYKTLRSFPIQFFFVYVLDIWLSQW